VAPKSTRRLLAEVDFKEINGELVDFSGKKLVSNDLDVKLVPFIEKSNTDL